MIALPKTSRARREALEGYSFLIVGAAMGTLLFAGAPMVRATTLAAHVFGLVYAWQGRFTPVPLYGSLPRAVPDSAA